MDVKINIFRGNRGDWRLLSALESAEISSLWDFNFVKTKEKREEIRVRYLVKKILEKLTDEGFFIEILREVNNPTSEIF